MRTDTHAGARLYTFLDEAGGGEESLTYRELDLRARRIGVALQALAQAGERAVLLYPPGLEYIAGFFGCLYSGLVAVPAYPPDPSRLDRTLPRLRAIIQDARASVVLTTSPLLAMGEFLFEQAPDLAALRWLATDTLPEGAEGDWRRPEAAASTLAFLQYTSGSTGSPKGVMLSHGNLLHNLGLISRAFEARPDSMGVIWLPPYHDMGLIGGILEPLYDGFPVALLSPLAFLKRPRLWLEAISLFGGSISGGPNFAFELCVRKIPPAEREGLDLRSWEVAFCGAEPIRPEALGRFAEAFVPCGFRREAFYPCYGLAEGTLIASGGVKGRGPLLRAWDAAALERSRAVEVAEERQGSRTLVGCGRAMPDQTLAVVDPGTHRPCPPGQVGEIWLAGPSVAQGYWLKPEETAQAFQARLADTGEGPFLRTGDLGLLHGGELFVTGRLKDLIILRGRNLYPQDLERTVERSHPALRPGCGAAFAIEVDGEERLAVVQEVDPRRPWEAEEVVGAIRRHLSEAHEVQLHTLALLEPGSLPKTSSGKVQHRACRTELLGGTLRTLLTWRDEARDQAGAQEEGRTAQPTAPASAGELEAWLRARLPARLGVRPEELAPDAPLTRFGLDSLSAVELAHEIERGLGVVLPMEILLQGPTLPGLARRLWESRGSPGASIPRRPESPEAPLSFAQQRLWLFEQVEPGTPAYHLPAALRLLGPVDAAALEHSLDHLAQRHEALRTTFREEGGSPVQRVSPRPPPFFRTEDLRELPAEEREARALGRAREEARLPFDLGHGPLLRAALVRLGDEDHLLVLVMHHLVSDGASLGILARELGALYAAFAAGVPSPLPELPFQYPDYARWLRERAEPEGGAASLAWWRQRLAGAPAALELPADRPRPAVRTWRGSRVPVRIPEPLTAALEALGRREGATLFMTLLAAFQVLLQRHAGQEDFCVGTPVAGRDRANLEGLIGCFLNLLVLRTDLSGEPSFREVLARARAGALDAYAHQDVPFERLVEALHLPRNRSHPPLFQVLLVLQPDPGAGLALPRLQVHRVDVEPGATAYDLTLSLMRGANGLEGWLETSAELFDASTAVLLAARLRVVLEAAAADPDRRSSSLPLLPEDERRRMLVEWNATRAEYPVGCIHHFFEAQAGRTPEAVAVACGDEALTYRMLDLRANALAHRLRALGVGPERVVGLCADRSLELVVGLLGILKAGGAYLPLDPSYPEPRLAFMLENSGALVVLAHRHLAGALPASGAQVVLLDPPGAPGEAAAPPGSVVSPDNLAYVLYTSGSTGRPKGVLVPHRNVANFFTGMDARVGASPGAWLAVTSISFDISVLELLWTLARGFQVDVQGEDGPLAAPARRTARAKPPGFSLFYFAEDADQGGDRYRLLLEGARFADRHGFEAVWTPERHLHAFGGLYPNPSVTGAALAAITERVGIRAGSVVLPLHHPVRVAEEWALVDNLSRGRVGVSFASGWHADDFILAPERYADRREVMRRGIDTVLRLWRGETVTLPGGAGAPVEVRVRPRPLQPELPFWLTAAGNPETFREAGRLGASVLTHLLGQSLAELRERIALYREARAQAGHPGEGHVTLMLHTFVERDAQRVRELVEGPFRRYLASSADLMRGLGRQLGVDLDSATVRPEDLEAVAARAFERYFETSGLFGTPRTCRDRVAELHASGVDEVACLIDFGVDADAVLASLPALDALRQRCQRDAQLAGGEAVPARIRRRGITHLQCTPSLARALLLDPEAPGALAGLTRLLVGGEALPAPLAEQLRRTVGGGVLNMYGPTETTIWSSTHRVDGAAGPVPIGAPIANTAFYVLDARLEPLPPGVPGELYIGGAGVARGYHARPELTAERFVPEPFGGEAGARMYRTGDRVRWRSDGTVEFLGRVDQQVKVRGFRIEPGEIEAVLAQYPGVRQVVVAAREDAPGDARLVAWVVPAAEPWPGAEALQAFARQRLPEHLVPSVFVALAALPLTHNGKVDRRALPKPERARAAGEGFVAPRTPTEERLAALWSQLLGVEKVAAHDDFFALGGHSLLATQLVSRLRGTFQVELPLRELFAASTLAALAERLDAAGASRGPAAPPLVAQPRAGRLPLSFAQQRLWFLDQLEPGSTVYNMVGAVRLDGTLDVAALERGFEAVLQRHEALRTTFQAEAGEPRQVISAPRAFSLPVVDLRPVPDGARQPELQRLAAEEAERPFDLAAGPLLRATLLRLSGTEHVLLLSLHHIVSDGWSMGILIRELSALYAAFATGAPTPLPPLPIQYADFALWQRAWLTGDVLQAQLAYWKQQLAFAPGLLELSTDRPRPPVQSHRGAFQPLRVPRLLAEALEALGQRHGATPFMTFLAAFQVLLHRYSGQDDLCVGSPIAGRNRAEVEGLIGFFANTLVLRSRLSPGAAFSDLLRQVRQTTLDAYAHQDLPFEKLVEELQPARSLSHSPLFQVMLEMFEDPNPERTLPGLVLRALEVEQRTSKFDLTLSLSRTEQGLAGVLSYSTDLFDPDTIARMLGHLRVLLEGLAADPGRRLSELPLLSEPERHRVLVEWNDTRADFPKDACLHELFEARAARTPDAIAVELGGAWLTYRQLADRAHRLAHHLRRLGVRPGDRVALCVERSLELPVALLGILEAGGAYVPLDPDYPRERLVFMLEDSRARVLLAQARLAPRLPRSAACTVLLDAEPDPFAGESHLPPGAAVDPRSAAYVLYTSGSTGTPKGALISHRALVNHMAWLLSVFGLDAADRVLQKTPLSFDASVWECWAPLLVGGRLVLAEPGAHRDGPALLDAVVRHQVTVLQLVPSVLRALLEDDGLARATSLRWLFCGGEALPVELARRFRALLPSVPLVNLYGPTEATIDATFAQARVEDCGQTVPIGRPISNARAYVLDGSLQPAPPGVPGELYLGGEGLALGYLERPELTAERFLPDPFGGVPGDRLYRTGDRVRFLPDGALEYLGRLDDQVKVRGVRLELGELEAALQRHPRVRAAAAAVREDVPGERRLVAYTVPAGELPEPAALRAFLKETLPEHLVPSAFVALEALPRTPGGKLDRRALPAPGRDLRGRAAWAEPRTGLERRLAELWARTLGVERVGLQDNFFELGGDSIVSLQVIARARQAGIRLTARQMFQHQTLAELAKVAEAGPATGEQGPVRGPVRLTPIQRWFLERELPEAHHFNQALLLELREPLDAALLEQALRQLVEHHDALRLRLVRVGEGWEQSCAEPAWGVSVRRVDLSAVPEAAQPVAIEEAAAAVQGSLDLGEGLLLRAALFDRGPGKSGRLLLAIHHLAVDGVSWRVLLEDLETAVRQLRQGHPAALPAKTTSFQEWALRLEAHAQSAAVAAELPFWREETGGEVAPLPRDGDGGEGTLSSARTLTVALEPGETRALLREVAPARRVGVDDVLLAAVAHALAAWTGQGRLRVDVEGHGREELFEGVDLSRTVGWFTTLFPVRLELPPGAGPEEALEAVRGARRRRPGRGLGYGLLRYLRQGDVGQLRALPPAEVLFNYLGQLDAAAPGASLFGLAPEPSGPAHGRHGRLSHALEVVGRVVGGRLELSWTWSEALHGRATLEALAHGCVEALRVLIAGRRAPALPAPIPADFPLAGLDAAALARILARTGSLEDLYPLSPLQQGLLFHALLDTDSQAYFEQRSWALHAPLDVPVLRSAWAAVLERHAALRAAFLWEGLEEPLQAIPPQVELPWKEHDWRGVPPEEQAVRLEALLREDRARGFDLSHAPLLRLALIRLDDRVHRLVWSSHHLLLDGWSLARVLREVFAGYTALVRGEELRWERAPDFRGYIAWLRRREPGRDEAFWREALAGTTAPTPLPGAPGAGPARGTGEQELALGPTATQKLQDFVRRHALTPSTLAHAAWALLLARYGGGTDVTFGTVVSGRPPELPGVEERVGLFIQSLPVRVRPRPGERVLPWLEALQAQLLELGQREPVSLPQIQGWSEVPRGTPLFESLLVFENYPVDESLRQGAGGLDARDFQGFERTHYPLTAVALPGPSLRLKLLYESPRFDADTAARLLAHWRAALEGLAAEPDRRLGDVPLLSEAERRRVLEQWNDTRTAYPREATVHALYQAQARRTSEAVAVTFGDISLTYRELERRANRLAHRLRALGAGRGTRVALCMERSADLVAGMLAILKAGAAYVPLDPAYPRERLAWMLADAGAPVVLTQARLRGALPEGAARVLCLDEEGVPGGLAEEGLADVPPDSGATADDLAYVLYTSGSAGTPKGVCIPHRAVVRLVVETDFIRITPRDRMAQASNASFDAATFEVWGALLHGARLVGVEREVALAPRSFAAWLREQEISILFLTTAWFNQVVAEIPDAFAGLRQLHFGGEAVDVRPVRAVLREGPPGRLLHVYGPTESTTFASWYPVEAVSGEAATLPIGRPLANTGLYVVDEAGAPVPPGGAGELWIGGDGLAWGYLQRPELTAERFVPDPFSAAPGARLYRTGDRVRLRPDGAVEFLRRLDAQVKVRGFRVEPGEVEAALRKHPSVGEAAVLARQDAPGTPWRLVAYAAPAPGQALDVRALRRFLAQSLPEYLVPSAFVALERLPLTPNGKVDRRALPASGEVTFAPDAAWTAPRGPVEELLAALWGPLLGAARVGAHDSFFELGGHSLLATRLVSRVRAAFGVELSLRDLFDAPTVAGLAQRISAAGQRPEAPRPPPLVPIPREGPLPLSFAQQRLWFLDQLQPQSAFYNVGWSAWVEGPLDVAALERALEALIRRHEALRTTFRLEAGEPVQVIQPPSETGREPVLKGMDLRELTAQDREPAALQAAEEALQRPFDLTVGPLFRAALFRTDEVAHLLVLTMHHIISDGGSLAVAVRELVALYEASSDGRPSPLPALAIQPADQAVWQRGWLQGPALEAQLEYWRRQLSDAPRVLELPADFPRPPVQSFRGASLPVRLPAPLSEALRALCRREGATPFMALLAAFQLLLSRSSGQDDVCVGSPIAGRGHAELEGLIGFFANTLVLRTRLAPELTFRELLGRVRETTLGAYAHQEVPFEKLVEALQPPRRLSHPPLFQVVLAFQNAPPPGVAPPGLTLRPVALESGTAKFDLTLSLTDGPDGFAGTLEYCTDLFTAITAGRMLEHLRTLLKGAVADPARRLGELPLMGGEERRRLLVDWNDTRADYPREACLHALFEAQAARTPEAVAVECDGARLTYRELDLRANQLARHLARRGVGPGTPVGLCVQRSLELVVGTLGILKAGGAYVPLDPTYPRERLAFMVEDARLPLLLTQRPLREALPEHGAAAVLLLDEDWGEVAREREDAPGFPVPAEALAYIMYTSGSTGRPKGVCVPHRAVVRLVIGTRFAELGPREVFLQLAPICFDAATFELWGSLLHGARLVLFPPHTPTVDELHEALARHGVTTLWLTAALFEQLSIARPEALAEVRQLLAGGDVLPPGAVRERLARGGVLINGYGPTEGTTFSCCHPMAGSIPEGPVPIGRPIANTRAYVVDRQLEPVPIGVPGELLIGGDGLAWGYLHRPELTAEQFIPAPFGPEPGERLYRTGDRVRYRPDGLLEFLGRLDAQVKVRGYRVEPGEVEDALRQHPAVGEAVVVARPDPAGGKRLLAYAVPRPGRVLEPRELRAFLAQRLPEYMVPSALVPLEALPLSLNGKIDRQALPAPEAGRPAEAGFVEPTTPLERQLAALWGRVLGVERVGVQDHFFEDLGGSSMAVIKACALLREELKHEVPVTRFFEHPTVRALAASLEREGEGAREPGDNQPHQDRAELRRQALRRQGRKGGRGNG